LEALDEIAPNAAFQGGAVHELLWQRLSTWGHFETFSDIQSRFAVLKTLNPARTIFVASENKKILAPARLRSRDEENSA
jgi:hypothetical protein